MRILVGVRCFVCEFSWMLCLLEAVGDLKVVGRDYTLQFRREQSFGKEKTIEGFD